MNEWIEISADDWEKICDLRLPCEEDVAGEPDPHPGCLREELEEVLV